MFLSMDASSREWWAIDDSKGSIDANADKPYGKFASPGGAAARAATHANRGK